MGGSAIHQKGAFCFRQCSFRNSGLEDAIWRIEEVEKNYAEEKFPGVEAVEALVPGDIIRRCWDEQVDSATDVLKFIVLYMLSKMAA
jgi:hypothetical protein